MNIKQPTRYTMENETSDQIPDNATRTDASVPSYSVNFDDIGTSLMSNFISEREPMLRLAYLVVLSLATGMGNLLVLVAVLKFPSLRRPTNAMLGSLALSDFLVGTVTVPLYTAWTTKPGIFDRSAFMCGLVLMSCLVVVTASQVSLLLLSVEQFVAVCHPFRHRNIFISCPRLHALGIMFAWVSSFLTAAISLLAYEKKPSMPCNYYSVFDETFLFVASIFGVFFPFALIIYFNVKVLCVVKENEKKMSFAYRRDDNCPILRKKSRVERASFNFSSSKTDGSLYDPSHRLSSIKGDECLIEISNYSNREGRSSVDDSVQRKMSITKTSLRSKFATMSTCTKESDVDIEVSAYVSPPCTDECREGVTLEDHEKCFSAVKNKTLYVLVEGGTELRENSGENLRKSIQSLLLCDGSVLLDEGEADTVASLHGLIRAKGQEKTWLEGSETLTRRWSLPCDKNYAHKKDFRPDSKSLRDNLDTTLTADDVAGLCNTNSEKYKVDANSNNLNTNRICDASMHGHPTPADNDKTHSNSFSVPKFYRNYQNQEVTQDNQFSEGRINVHGLNVDMSSDPVPNPRHQGYILKDKASSTPILSLSNPDSFPMYPFHPGSSVEKNTLLLSNEIGFSDCMEERLTSLRNRNSQSLNSLNELKGNCRVGYGLKAQPCEKSTTFKREFVILDRKANLPTSFCLIDKTNIHSKCTFVSEETLLSRNTHKKILPAESFLYCHKNDCIQTHAFNNLTKNASIEQEDINGPCVYCTDKDLRWNSDMQEIVQRLGTPNTIKPLYSSDAHTKGPERKSCNSERGTVESKDTYEESNLKILLRKAREDSDMNEVITKEITMFLDPTDAETSVDSGISVDNSPENPDIELENTDSIQPDQTTTFEDNKIEENGDETREKPTGCLPKVSAAESFRGLRLKRRLRSLSFSSVGVSQKVRWMVALVCATFILAWFPFFAVILANMFCDSCTLTYFLNMAIMVAFSKSMANPVVYALCHVEFRRAYAKVFKAIGLKSCCSS